MPQTKLPISNIAQGSAVNGDILQYSTAWNPTSSPISGGPYKSVTVLDGVTSTYELPTLPDLTGTSISYRVYSFLYCASSSASVLLQVGSSSAWSTTGYSRNGYTFSGTTTLSNDSTITVAGYSLGASAPGFSTVYGDLSTSSGFTSYFSGIHTYNTLSTATYTRGLRMVNQGSLSGGIITRLRITVDIPANVTGIIVVEQI